MHQAYVDVVLSPVVAGSSVVVDWVFVVASCSVVGDSVVGTGGCVVGWLVEFAVVVISWSLNITSPMCTHSSGFDPADEVVKSIA